MEDLLRLISQPDELTMQRHATDLQSCLRSLSLAISYAEVLAADAEAKRKAEQKKLRDLERARLAGLSARERWRETKNATVSFVLLCLAGAVGWR